MYLVTRGFVMSAQLLVLRDGGDQGAVLIKHLLSVGRGGCRSWSSAGLTMRRSIGVTGGRGRRTAIGFWSLGSMSTSIGGRWRLLGPRRSRRWRLGGNTRHWQH